MGDQTFSREDIRQIQERGMNPEDVLSQIESFRKGFPPARLRRPCTPGDGILTLDSNDLERLGKVSSGAVLKGRALKFVPASGAATRMFKSLLSLYRLFREQGKTILPESGGQEEARRALRAFIEGIRKFAFWDELRASLSREGLDPETLIHEGQYIPLLDHVLTSRGLALADLPKGLIRFHRYPDHPRTPFEEHLAEAAAYVRDAGGVARLHFTVSPEHEEAVRAYLGRTVPLHEGPELRFEWGISVQRASTDTIAVDMENRPFRDGSGKLVFRPAGHGALLKNLVGVGGDIVFIKNIDNVVPDRLRGPTTLYKKALCGCLLEYQDRIFDCLGRLSKGGLGGKELDEIFLFTREGLSIEPPPGMDGLSKEEKGRYLISRLNRPLRVCGMVRNVGEPGGGPFWVESPGGALSIQIVESSQVDMASPEQRAIWKAATHFNPVDLVCGVRDFKGRPFDLEEFTDPGTGFISIKSMEGRDLKALELPGLWNGAMGRWNTVFVEVPIITFNPVKTVLDLLRDEHQPGSMPSA